HQLIPQKILLIFKISTSAMITSTFSLTISIYIFLLDKNWVLLVLQVLGKPLLFIYLSVFITLCKALLKLLIEILAICPLRKNAICFHTPLKVHLFFIVLCMRILLLVSLMLLKRK